MADHAPEDVLMVLTTIPASAVQPVVRSLLDERLVACANLMPVGRSLYRWEGRIEEGEEQVVLLKTVRARRDALRVRLAELHPYDVPEILEWAPTGGAAAYLEWVAECCRPEG